MVILTALLQAKKGMEEEFETALRIMIPETAQEKGALEYRLHRSKSNPESYFFYEKYVDQAALDAHLATPYYKALIEKVGPLLAQEPLVDTYTFLEGIPEGK